MSIIKWLPRFVGEAEKVFGITIDEQFFSDEQLAGLMVEHFRARPVDGASINLNQARAVLRVLVLRRQKKLLSSIG